MSKNLIGRGAVAAVLLLASVAASAQQGDPPARVGRISYLEGTVSYHAADQGGWLPATLNYPVVAGHSYWTEPRSLLELQVGPAEFRLDETTALDILLLDENGSRLRLDQGVINIHLRSMEQGWVQVVTPAGYIDLVEPGSYDINVGHPAPDRPPERERVTVLEGRAEVNGARGRLEVTAGESAVVTQEPPSFTMEAAASTPFDDWALQRERREVVRESERYLSPGVTGYQDIDDYGEWRRDPGYGAVWFPADVPPGWEPYRFGHWAFVPPWGWTWIDDAPWGFAPFHYGRWVEIGDRWAWWPGTVQARPVYAPALVAFIGGAGFGVAVAGAALPAVAWVPLAPHEAFRPYYHASPTYVRNVNVTTVHTTVINNITTINNTNTGTATRVTEYRNQRAATVVPAAAFTHAAPVHQAAVALPRDQLAQAHVTPTLEHLQPSAAARAGIATPAAARIVPHSNAPATIAPASPNQRPAALERDEPAPPKAPGPAFTPRERREATPSAPQPRGPAQAAPRTPPPAAPTPPHAPAAATPAAPPPRVASPPPSSAPPSSQTVHTPPPVPPNAQASHTPTAQPPRPPAALAATPKPPPVQVERPVQHAPLAPTPQGWVRGPQPAAAAPPHPQAPPPAHAQPAAPPHGQPPAKDNKKPDDPHKPGG
jgi:uncharacterized protein DUF6600